MAKLEKSGKMMPGSRVGAPVPDVSTPAALKQVLINTKAIVHADPKIGGTSIIHLMKIPDGLGIKDVVAAKGVNSSDGNDAVAKVAKGEAELAIVLVSEIHEKGAKLVALLPEEVQLWTVYSAAIPANSKEPEHARALVSALTAPAMRPRWVAAGLGAGEVETIAPVRAAARSSADRARRPPSSARRTRSPARIRSRAARVRPHRPRSPRPPPPRPCRDRAPLR